MKVLKYFIIALIVIVIDQASKLLVHHNMYLHEEVNVIGEWFRLHYLLNPGMAFGLKWENEFGKLALTVFRIGAMFGIGYYLYKSAVKGLHNGFLICLALILGGAIGNVIDSTFYGVLLNNAPPESPTQWFHGQVIDMLFFPIFEFSWPEWVPYLGGEYFLFFSPVFNLADSAIFLGVVSILIWQKRFFPHLDQHVESNISSENENPTLNSQAIVEPSVQQSSEESTTSL
jgi:signal peptidase II